VRPQNAFVVMSPHEGQSKIIWPVGSALASTCTPGQIRANRLCLGMPRRSPHDGINCGPFSPAGRPLGVELF
jgi:hypothetical protein